MLLEQSNLDTCSYCKISLTLQKYAHNISDTECVM